MSALTLIHQRCFNHSTREAAARCPECRHFYCRECITEHDDRVICAACLKKFAKQPFSKQRGFIGVLRLIQLLTSVFLVWLFFYWCGQTLLSLDSSFHEGTIWRKQWLDHE
jgi:hypothetical protein